jgi:hypothetical protein
MQAASEAEQPTSAAQQQQVSCWAGRRLSLIFSQPSSCSGFSGFLTGGTLLSCAVLHSLLMHCLQDGQLVTFSEVVGMTQLNSHKPVKVKNCKVGPQRMNLRQLLLEFCAADVGAASTTRGCTLALMHPARLK